MSLEKEITKGCIICGENCDNIPNCPVKLRKKQYCNENDVPLKTVKKNKKINIFFFR